MGIAAGVCQLQFCCKAQEHVWAEKAQGTLMLPVASCVFLFCLQAAWRWFYSSMHKLWAICGEPVACGKQFPEPLMWPLRPWKWITLLSLQTCCCTQCLGGRLSFALYSSTPSVCEVVSCWVKNTAVLFACCFVFVFFPEWIGNMGFPQRKQVTLK